MNFSSTKRKKKICLINPTLIVRRPLKEMAHLLFEQGYELGVMIPKNFKHNFHSDFARKNKNITLHEYNIFNTPLSQFEWPIPLLKFWFLSFKILWHYDVVQLWSHFYLNNFLFILLSYFFPRTKIILTMDTVPGYSFKTSSIIDKTLKIYTRTICKLQFLRSNKITLYGDSLLPFAKKAKLPLKKTVVVPTGLIDFKIPTKKTSYEEVSKASAMSISELKKKKIISFIGLMNDRKGVDVILEVILAMKKNHPKVYAESLFLFLGEGVKQDDYEEFAKKNSLINAKFLGYRKDKHKFLSVSDIFFFPSRGEGLAGVIMEAMKHKLAILTTKIPCTIDLIEDSKEGLLINVDDLKEFEKSLIKLIKNDALRKKLGEAAYKKIIKEHDWAKVLKQYEEVYNV